MSLTRIIFVLMLAVALWVFASLLAHAACVSPSGPAVPAKWQTSAGLDPLAGFPTGGDGLVSRAPRD